MRGKLRRRYQVHKEVARAAGFDGDIPLSALKRLGESTFGGTPDAAGGTVVAHLSANDGLDLHLDLPYRGDNIGDAKVGFTIPEDRDAEKNALEAKAMDHPLVQAVFDAFPNAKILEIRSLEDIAAEAQVEALPEVDEEWDPFEED